MILMKKNITLYNLFILAMFVYAPWLGAIVLLILFPAWIMGSFGIISAVSKIENKKLFFKKHIGKVGLFIYISFLAGVVSEILLNWFFLDVVVTPENKNIVNYSGYGDDIRITFPAVLIAGGLTFVFAKFVIFKKLEKKQSTKISLALAISTAPYWLMIPTGLFFHH